MTSIRSARRDDLPALLGLCAEHARFERAQFAVTAAGGLEQALWGSTTPRLWCLVLEDSGVLRGYATYGLEFATWTGREYVHLDCLYLRETHRGKGWGTALLREVTRAAVALGCLEVQWQTPTWNHAAIRFYEHYGATSLDKIRFTLAV